MEQISNRVGHTLLEFIHLASDEAINPVIHSPLVASLVVADHKGRVLLVFDRYKRFWELPGGGIEVGESPRACAIRELMEETGQLASDLDFVGIAKIRWEQGKIIFLAVYSCRLPMVLPFQANDEIEKTEYWDFQSDIDYIDEIDQYLAASVINH